jgi:C4-dicarboxylate-specific signal transduction histidine kinase
LREWNEEIASAANRAGQIIARLRNFARRRDMKRDRGNVNDVARESVELVAFEGRRRGVAVRLELSPEPITADFDRVQIQQVLVNLLRNAFEAMEATPPGQREVAVRTAIVGQSIEVTVADHGPGLSGEGLKIFDAFVTTKPDGLGMGLAISRTIVEAHGGKLWAAPDLQGGAAFRFTMPLT